MSEQIVSLENNLEIWRFALDEIMEQDVNARVQEPEMFERLSGTIAKDKRLESLPFGVLVRVKKEMRLSMISGHHRVRAARAAGISEIYVLADTRKLTRSQIVAKQIAHNAIEGKDDPETLKRMWLEVDDVNDKLEAYLDPSKFVIPEPGAIKLDNIDLGFSWRYVTLLFLPKQYDQFEDLCRLLPTGDTMWGVCDEKVFEGFKETVKRLGKQEDIRSVGAIVARMCEICNEVLKEKKKEE